MKYFRNTLIALVVILVLAFIAGSFVAKHEAEKAAKRISEQLKEQSHGQIMLTYQSVSANAIGLITHSGALNNVSIIVNDPRFPKANITAPKVTISTRMEISDKADTPIDVNFSNLSILFNTPLTGKHSNHKDNTKESITSNVFTIKKLLIKLIPNAQGQIKQLKINIDHFNMPHLSQLIAEKLHQIILKEAQQHDVNAKTSFKELANIISRLNVDHLNFSGSLNYQGSHTSIPFNLKLKNQNSFLYEIDGTLKPNATGNLLNTSLTDTLFHAQITRLNKKVSFNIQFSPQDLQALKIEKSLNALGYSELNFKGQAQSSYQADKAVTQGKFDYQMIKGFALKGNFKVSQVPVTTVAQLFNEIKLSIHTIKALEGDSLKAIDHFNELSAAQEKNTLINSFSLSLIDEGLANKALTLIAKKMNSKPEAIQSQAKAFILLLASEYTNQGLTVFSNALNAFAQFIDKPKQLTFSIQPKAPFSLKQLHASIAQIEKANDLKRKEIVENKALTHQEKDEQLKKYEQTHNIQLNTLLTNIGISTSYQSA